MPLSIRVRHSSSTIQLYSSSSTTGILLLAVDCLYLTTHPPGRDREEARSSAMYPYQGLRWFCWVAGRLHRRSSRSSAHGHHCVQVLLLLYSVSYQGGSFWLLLLRCVISGFQTRNQMSYTTYTGGTHSRQTARPAACVVVIIIVERVLCR